MEDTLEITIIDGPPVSYLCTPHRCKFLTHSSNKSNSITEEKKEFDTTLSMNTPFHVCDEEWHWIRDITFSIEALNNVKHIFVHIPKTGGTSILSSPTLLCAGHIYARYYPRCYREKIFTIVRNPYSRLVSAYLFMKRGGFRNNRAYLDLVQQYPTFESWVLSLNEKDLDYTIDDIISEVIAPQYIFLCGESESDIIIPRKNILRFENYAKDVERHLGIPNDEQHHYNITSSSDKYRKFFYANDVVKNKVYHLYKMDFVLFGYHREVIPTFSPCRTMRSVVLQMSSNRVNKIDSSITYAFGLEAFHNPKFFVSKDNTKEWFSFIDELFIASYYSDNKSTCDELAECLLTFILRNDCGAKIYAKRIAHINRNLNFIPQKGRFDWPLSSKEHPCVSFSSLPDKKKKRLFEFFRDVPAKSLCRKRHSPRINCVWCKIA